MGPTGVVRSDVNRVQILHFLLHYILDGHQPHFKISPRQTIVKGSVLMTAFQNGVGMSLANAQRALNNWRDTSSLVHKFTMLLFYRGSSEWRPKDGKLLS